jgi:RNA polymerase sigma-70 factor (ECF subfamily)
MQQIESSYQAQRGMSRARAQAHPGRSLSPAGTFETPQPSGARVESLRRVWPFIPSLRKFVGRRVSANDIEDIVQESLVRVWNRVCDEQIENPKSYLLRIASAVIIDRSRRERTRQLKMHCSLEERHHPDDRLSPHRIAVAHEQLTIFVRAFECLPERTREIVTAIRLEGHSFKAVAEGLGITVSAVEKQLAHGLSVLSLRVKDAGRGSRSIRST